MPVIFLIAAVIILFWLKVSRPFPIEIRDLPKIFSDESEADVALRPDLAKEHGADKCYRIFLMRCYITYVIRNDNGDHCELFAITYCGRPGPMIEVENERPVRFIVPKTPIQKVFFLSHELRDIASFTRTVRVLAARHRAPA